ncbi:hypothetical protein FKW15_12865 [Acetobacter sp. DmW_125133]|nr:hypothetical protein FKW22_14005 [Acetobacter sp. DmW_125124]KAA8393723.1 hypothetical protein FKW20_14930 [Acetobacter sp. DmW_125127]KAA8394360.1 hypothetical protein FKW19_12675 [Acetobacter sp. DmW_125128]KAA8402099.1 hypothetical protein FKW32_14520 [Acetobacter sp. DmW_125132]KAA8402219.1 hypothetical protein FKW15_12865 [Acetobacter sp. DmW_125133]KAA8403469.1 hypothetical protein FKW24_11185 [Acetobacter sp. DmW_125134]KAA8410879.1 hypothetical protein FKW18_11335 [Acetobacter sp. 
MLSIRFFFGGIQAVMYRSARDCLILLLSHSRSPMIYSVSSDRPAISTLDGSLFYKRQGGQGNQSLAYLRQTGCRCNGHASSDTMSTGNKTGNSCPSTKDRQEFMSLLKDKRPVDRTQMRIRTSEP